MEERLYCYRAYVTKVYDGDTCTVDIDLGINVWVRNEKIRLLRIDAPEIRGEERPQGLLSRDYLRELILDREIIIETFKDRKGKYGRYLGEIWLKIDGVWQNINDMMVASGHAIYRDY